MNSSTIFPLPGQLLQQMQAAAKRRFRNFGGWAKAAGIPKETLSRLRTNASCDLRTLEALAHAAGYIITVAPATTTGGGNFPDELSRELEMKLLDLAASGNTDSDTWRQHGPAFFMGGLAVMLAGSRGFDREKYLRLADELHPGISTPEVFDRWLQQTPLRASRFLPMARKRKGIE
jgi:hypothetical protein